MPEEPPHPSPDTDPDAAAPPAPLLTLRDGLPPVVETPQALRLAVETIAAGTGPVAIDAERASGYRYSGRAYLLQVRREGAGTTLVDPIGLPDLEGLAEVLRGPEWILHAATQDLPCLAELGLRPVALFDTELAGRLLGLPRVALATLVEALLGTRLRKEHSAVDWSTRPLPVPWLEYAALDVEVLLELREELDARLEAAGKQEWARQEFDALLGFVPSPRPDAWRRTSGLHRLRSRRGLGAVRELWLVRDSIAAERDITPTRILPDSALLAAATALPRSRASLLATPGFHGRGARRHAPQWVAAILRAVSLPESELPPRAARTEGPPVPRAWAERDPVAARRLARARSEVAELAERWQLPAENLLTPEHLRRVLWSPPATRESDELTRAVSAQLAALGARPWQVELTAAILARAVIEADRPATAPRAPETPSPV